MKTEPRIPDDVFEARLRLGLRELDGLEGAPDVSADVLRRLEQRDPAANQPSFRWLALLAALLAIAVTVTLLVRGNGARTANDPARAGATEPTDQDPKPQDPARPWRLVYQVTLDERQAGSTGNEVPDPERRMSDTVRELQRRLGKQATVLRGDAATVTVTVTVTDPSSSKVAGVRALLETPGRLELRAVADGDYIADGGKVRFDMSRQREQLVAWLDRGGRERLQQDPRAITEYPTGEEPLRWFVRVVRPDADRAGFWGWRCTDVPALATSTVAAHADRDWNGGTIPAHIQALPAEQRFLLELVAVNMHEMFFRETDLERISAVAATDISGSAVDYRLRAARASDFANFSEKYIGKCCAVIWNGEVLAAPRFESRIAGNGRIVGLSAAQANTIASILTTPVGATLYLLRSEPDTTR